MRRQWTGVGTALVTPFTRDGSIDEAGVRRLARRQVEGGIHFLCPCGTTGEAPTLTDDEKVRVVEIVVEEVRGQAPVLAGAGGYNTHEVVALVKRMERAGAQGILSVTPYYNKPTQEGLYEHYKAIAEATRLPIVVYNVPSRTGCNVETPTLLRLAEIKNIVAVKEASGSIAQITDVCAQVPEDFIVLSGDDAMTLPLMSVGGHGVISVSSNEIPAEMVQMVALAEQEDYRGARKLFQWMLPLLQVNFIESNPGPVKAAMSAMGLLDEHYRLPMVPPRQASRDKVLKVLQDLKLLGAAARV